MTYYSDLCGVDYGLDYPSGKGCGPSFVTSGVQNPVKLAVNTGGIVEIVGDFVNNRPFHLVF